MFVEKHWNEGSGLVLCQTVILRRLYRKIKTFFQKLNTLRPKFLTIDQIMKKPCQFIALKLTFSAGKENELLL